MIVRMKHVRALEPVTRIQVSNSQQSSARTPSERPCSIMIMMTVQVGLPVLNGERYLDRCLNSLLSQRYPCIEILISDNGSIDGTVELAKSFERDYRNVHFFPGEKGTAVDNFRWLLERADSNAFMWAAHDDLWGPEFVATGIEALQDGFDYWVPKWWIGDIEDDFGWEPREHPLSFVSSSDAVERVISYINMRHESFKDILVYGLFGTDFLKAAMSRYAGVYYEWADNDSFGNTLGALICWRGRGRTSSETQFWKQNEWYSDLLPRYPILMTGERKTSLRNWRLARLKRRLRKAPSRSLRATGLVELCQHFPELTKTICSLFENQTEIFGEFYLCKDHERYKGSAFAEFDFWRQQQQVAMVQRNL